ncbi:hypothetical protein C2S53_008351 [Perilla frutescens var. hirtella]|uniref:Pectinesterase inhibitor domain-containing protein n=1 Tax=Perilla frutescens var. hirtella TaxID=608512 RepID=A0AAD4JEV0_PERFH|nr:hypothetical protein C2S53_008351 [Perilla frutescens var. hirtella]
MAPHNNPKLFFLFFFSFLLLCHLAQPEVSPSPAPESSSEFEESEPISSPSPSPSPSPGPTSASPSSPGPAPVPSPSPSPSSGPAPGPTRSSGPSPGPSPSSDDDDLDDEVDTQQDSISLPPSFSDTPSPSMAPGPGADGPSDSDSPIEFDFSPTLAPSADVDPQLKKICDSTDYSSLCLATVSPYLDGKTDITSVLDVAIQAGSQFSKYGQATAQKLAGNPGNPPELASILNDCKENFESAVENFGKASDALPEHDKGTVNTMLSAVITYAGDCHDSITQDSPLYSISDRLMNMASNCLAISSLMN